MKIGVVFEGGASRASFTNGVIDVLLREKIGADYVIGVSAGIGSGISYVSGQEGRNHEISMKYMSDKRYMGGRYLFKRENKSYYNINFVFDEIPNLRIPFDYEAFGKFGGTVLAGVTNLETGKAEFLPLTGEDKAWKALLASCALPGFFRPVEIDGKIYMDGGVAVPIPYAKALRDGCDKVIVVLTRERSYKKEDKSFVAGLAAARFKNHRKFAAKIAHRSKLYNACREKLFALEKEGRIFVIAPDSTEHFSRTERNPAALEKLYLQGIDCAEKSLDKLKDYLK